jgi:hypothetical protein
MEFSARALLAASAGPTWNYQVTGTRHLNFSDYDAYYLAAPLRHLLPLGTVARNRGLTITNAYLTAFLDQAVHGQPQPLLTDTATPCPEVHPQNTHT